ncbi:MAG: hypothetical protein V7K47_18960 [Nostoc sp.]
MFDKSYQVRLITYNMLVLLVIGNRSLEIGEEGRVKLYFYSPLPITNPHRYHKYSTGHDITRNISEASETTQSQNFHDCFATVAMTVI